MIITKNCILHFISIALSCILLITLQGCASKRVLINPYQEPDPATTNVARVRIAGAATGYFSASVYKNPTKASCIKAIGGSDLDVFVMEFGKERSTKIHGMPTLSEWNKRIGAEFYFKADEPIVIATNFGGSSTSYTGIGYSTNSYSCVFAASFTPENKKDYEMRFGLYKGENGRSYCGVFLDELIPDPKNSDKTIGVNVPVEKVDLYGGSDEEVATKCAGSKP